MANALREVRAAVAAGDKRSEDTWSGALDRFLDMYFAELKGRNADY